MTENDQKQHAASVRHFIRPTFERVLIKRKEALTEINGIMVPDQSQERPAEGWIVALGPGVWYAPNETAPNGRQIFALGELVIFNKYAGKDVVVDENTPNEARFVLLQQDEIEGVVMEFALEPGQ